MNENQMTFPNAYAGIKRVFTAQILSLISSACYFLGAVIAAIGGIAQSFEGIAGGGVFLLGGAVLSLLALIYNLVGLSRASKDEPLFRPAFICSVIILIVSIVLTFLTFFIGNTANVILSLITQIFSILIIKYVFGGISSLADSLGRQDIKDYGDKLVIFLYVVYGLSIALYLLQLIFNSSLSMMSAVSVMSTLANIASIVGYILYLVYLGKSKNMLKA